MVDSAWAAGPVPFTINMSENVVVTGSPRIAIDVGGTTRYAVYASGSGTSTLIFNYTIQAGDNDTDGVVLSSPIDLNGGTIKDLAGNDSSLTFVVPNTSGILINTNIAPTGYSIAYTQDTVTNANMTSLAFQFAGATVGTTYAYTISSSGGGGNVTGSGTIATATDTISGINVSGMNDGILTASVTLSNGAVGAAVTDTIPKAVLNSNLKAHWTFDANDISGASVLDRSGNNLAATAVNSPVQVAGRTGNGLQFNGTSMSIQTPNDALIKTGFPITLSMWVNPDVTTAANGSGLFGNDQDGIYHLGVRATISVSGSLLLTMGDFTGCDPSGRSSKVTGGGVITSGAWQHLAFVMTGPTAMTIYVNGVDVGGTYSGTSPSPGPVYNSGTGGIIAGAMGCGGLTPFFGGIMDDVRYYDAALTGAQVLSLYNIH